MKRTILCDINLYGTLEIYRRFGGSSTVVLYLLLASSAFSSILEMAAVSCSEKSVIYENTRRHISEDSTAHSHCCENHNSLMSY
jgi:hypothetical protein